MPEKGHFIVDSKGEAELIAPRVRIPEMRIGETTLLHGTPADEQLRTEGPLYYVDPGGRVLDTKTGDIIAHGDGTGRVHIQDIQDHQGQKTRP